MRLLTLEAARVFGDGKAVLDDVSKLCTEDDRPPWLVVAEMQVKLNPHIIGRAIALLGWL